MKGYKCTCKVPNVENWSVIHVTAKNKVVRCCVCHQAWHTEAAYANELSSDLISLYAWSRFIKTPDYHRENEPKGDEGSYLDPAFVIRFLPAESKI